MSTSTFSYAQAAKGQSAAQAATSQRSPSHSQTPSVSGNQNRDTSNTNDSTRAPSVAVSTSSNDIDSSRSPRSASAKPDASRPNGTEASQDGGNTAASIAGSIGSSKVENELISTNGVPKGTESRGRSINTSSDTSEHTEVKKNRKPKKGKSAEKDAETGPELEKEGPPPKVELSEAPVPSVNFWVQRAQKAKTIDLPASTGTNPTQSTDSKTRSPNSETVDSNRGTLNGKQGSKKDAEPSRNGTNQGPRRAAPRGARAHEKQSEINLLANNPASWPTPETAAVNLKTQAQPQPEKPEKEEKEDGGAAKPKQKTEWKQLPDFVPSVKFETPVPSSTRGSRGGRAGGSRGGRDAAANHHTANPTERAQDANAGPRPNVGSKREGAGTREGRKNIPHAEHSRLLKESTSDNTNGEQLKSNHSGVVNGTNHEQSGQTSTPGQQSEENVKGSESQKDIKTLNNRDAHPQGQNTATHRNGERTRGGGRGRGGFNQNNPNGISHYAQNSYTNQHHAYQFPSNGSRQPPYGTGYSPMSYSFPNQPGPGQRKSTNGNRGRGSGRMPTMAPMNVPYDANMYPAPNSGIYPFDAGNNLLQLAQSQVEYYFSVDNCVKDWYLRTHMDSQGFVPIPFIASFNRMRELLVDLNILRQACQASALLELALGGDGIERVRSRKGWEKWVIPDMNLRDPSARHDGPSTWQQFGNGFQYPMMSPPYPVDTPPVFSPTSEHGFVNGNYGMPPLNAPTMNGINGHTRPHESQLSAAVPEFSPSTATFSGLKSTSQNSSRDAKAPTQKDLNGTVSPPEQFNAMANGVVHGQPQASVGSLHTTNGIDPGHTNEGYQS
ncbi:hypothetical protein F4803DRAFT_100716 [Xylaria telfairii]|nr:hypothetical protein F4803DRAFT_100716 [Xylaria telfairii]